MDKEQRIKELVEKCMPTLERFEEVEKQVFYPIPKPVEFSSTIRIYASTMSREAVKKTLALIPQVPQGDDEGLLTPEEIDKATSKIPYPQRPLSSHARDYEELLLKAQRDLTTRLIKQERLSFLGRRPELRKKIKEAIRHRNYTGVEGFDLDCIADQILVDIPDEEEIRKTLDTARTEIAELSKKLDDREIDLNEAVKSERERIIEWLDKRLSIHVTSKDGLSGWRWGLTDEDWQALKKGE